MEDRAKHHDAAIYDDEDPDCVEQNAEMTARKDAREEEKGTDFDGGDGWGVEYFCR